VDAYSVLADTTADPRRGSIELFAYLRPKLTRGERPLAYDHCPMLYYLFDAMPGYGLTWAYTARPATLRQLNAELNAKPLPRYAIRALVDVSHPVWRTAPRVSYADYPLNETVDTDYTLDRTIFPFRGLATADCRSLGIHYRLVCGRQREQAAIRRTRPARSVPSR
jgi:hypothetical protein